MTAATLRRDTVARVDDTPTTWERLRRVDPHIWDAAITVIVLTIMLSDLWFEPSSRSDTVGGD
jgi:hypothetical protein